MATASTGWYCAVSASVTSQTNTTATITVQCFWQNDGWNYAINNVSAWVYCGSSSYQVKSAGSINAPSNYGSYSCGSYSFIVNKTTSTQSISCYAKITSSSSYVSGTKNSSAVNVSVSAKPSYTVSYNANGGSGAPGAQTKWYGTDLRLSATEPTRSGYSFQGWATSAGGSVVYATWGLYTANASVTLYAVWKANTYTVSYNANGGSGAPGAQTKTHDVTLTLSSTKPTRTNYNFKGWGTSASSTTVSYAAGASYGGNASITLYAIWELAYTKPRINGLTVSRCNSGGTVVADGTYALVNFSWACDKTVSSIKIEWKLATASSYSSSAKVSASGTSGSVKKVIGANALSTNSSYTIRITVSDSNGNSNTTITLAGLAYTIHARAGGNGLGFGKPAELEGYADFAYKLFLRQGFSYYGDNTISTPDDDTTTKWGSYGNSIHFYNMADQLIDQQSVCGFLVNITTGFPEVHQLWFQQPNGNIWHRGGNSAGWNGTWRMLLDNSNYSDYALPINGGTMKGPITLPNNVSIYMKNSAGASRSMVGLTSVNNYLFGNGGYGANEGTSYYDGYSVHLRSKNSIYVTSPTAGLSGREYGVNKVLWSGAYYMNASQTITLSESILAQPHGIIMVWSAYINGAADNSRFSYHFIPKQHVASFSGCGANMTMFTTEWDHAATKYTYISPTGITGHASNTVDSAGSSVDYDNNYWVLRQVIGV